MSLAYTIKESFSGFRRNRSSTLITIFTVGIALLLLGVFAGITMNFSSVVNSIRERVEIEVFLKHGLSEKQHEQTAIVMRNIPGVLEVTYISKEEALRIFQKEVGEDFSDLLEDNPLPASFRVRLSEGYNNSDSARVIVSTAEKIKTVESVVYRKQFLELIDKRARAFRLATLFVGIILALSAVILVANTIRLTIYAKRELIRTMKLVGATPTFIRLPFVIEGMWHGLIGGILASILIGVAFGFFIQPLSEDLLVHISIGLPFFLFLILGGLLLGLLGSIVSVRRFLREAVVTQS